MSAPSRADEERADVDAIKEIGEMLAEFFKADPWKVTYWLVTPNLNFGGPSPAVFIQMRPQKALWHIRDMIQGNIA